jgi:hypothetical protein
MMKPGISARVGNDRGEASLPSDVNLRRTGHWAAEEWLTDKSRPWTELM